MRMIFNPDMCRHVKTGADIPIIETINTIEINHHMNLFSRSKHLPTRPQPEEITDLNSSNITKK